MASKRHNAAAQHGERKRKRGKMKSGALYRKLLKGDTVEVFSSDEGLIGSWHPATVLRIHKHVRVVEYRNILNEDSSANLIERITVCDGIEGRPWSPPRHYRANVRPLPPPVTESCELKYGLCVEALVDDAWWEGVIFDCDEGACERKVFFPDLGDQHLVNAEKLRVTQDWDVVTDCWKVRGEWILLTVLKEFEKDGFPVSVREIWYDLRITSSFMERIGFWTLGPISVWRDMVSEVIREIRAVCEDNSINNRAGVIDYRDNIDDIYEELPSLEESVNEMMNNRLPFGFTDAAIGQYSFELDAHDNFVSFGCTENSPALQIATVIGEDQCTNGNQSAVKYQCCSNVLSDFITAFDKKELTGKRYVIARKAAEFHLLAHGWKITRYNSRHLIYHSPYGKQWHSFTSACRAWKEVENSENWQNMCNGGCVEFCSNQGIEFSSNQRRNEKESVWKPVELDAAYGPDFIQLYALRGGHNEVEKKINKRDMDTNAIRRNLKRHLLAVGWKVEERAGRLRYVSPEKHVYYSLAKICDVLLSEQKGKVGRHQAEYVLKGDNIGKYEHKMLLAQSSRELGIPGLPLEIVDSSSVLVSGITETASSRDFKHQQNFFNDNLPTYEDLEPESTPEAVVAYKNFMDSQRHGGNRELSGTDVKRLRSIVKKHLLFMGWKLRAKPKENRTDLYYDSPSGKPYSSLYTACKAYLEEMSSEKKRRSNGSMNKRSEAKHLSALILLKDSKCHYFKEHDVRKLQVTPGKAILSSSSSVNCGKPSKEHSSLRKRIVKRRVESSDLFSFLDRHKKRKASKTSINWRSKKENLSRVSRSSKRSRANESLPSVHVAKTVLSWLIDNDVVLPRQKVRYVHELDNRVMMEGRISRDGIKCNCCHKVFSLNDFEAHARTNSRRPAEHIVLSDGRSLLECQIQMMHKKKLNDLPRARMKRDYTDCENDIICSVCHDGGDLVLCDLCPSSFHLDCLGLKDLPEGKWFCPSCKCGYCGLSEYDSATGQFAEETLLCCDQCEREYHVTCLQKHGLSAPRNFPAGDWFCSKKCSKIFAYLNKLLGRSNHTSREGLSWRLLRAKGVHDVETKAEQHSKLQVALQILHECFVTVIEPRTNSDFFADLLFNRESELKRLNFWGFYTVVLERGDEMISVATFRIFGEKVVEMPLIGTRLQYRRQGMCRLLVDQLEKLLSKLGAERLLLPAVPQLLETWTASFGFTKMTISDRLELLNYSILNFQETTMCQKILKRNIKASEDIRGNCQLDCKSSACFEKTDQQICAMESQVMEMDPSSPPSGSMKDSILVESGNLEEIHGHSGDADKEKVDEQNLGDQILGTVANDCIVENDTNKTTEGTRRVDALSNSEFVEVVNGGSNGREHLIKDINERTVAPTKYYYKRRLLVN